MRLGRWISRQRHSPGIREDSGSVSRSHTVERVNWFMSMMPSHLHVHTELCAQKDVWAHTHNYTHMVQKQNFKQRISWFCIIALISSLTVFTSFMKGQPKLSIQCGLRSCICVWHKVNLTRLFVLQPHLEIMSKFYLFFFSVLSSY